ncbi:HAD family hydrolase [Evansella sp. AB-rgal1]|uniref:HAD family hydrolase n=1 Tax=Evansella sp. AB-rgal1 TaxID=3242696 RepID=UPI00359D4069
MAIVTVDFDGTLYQGNSFKIMFQAGKKNFGLKEWGTVLLGVGKSVITGIAHGKNEFRLSFFRSFAKTFKGKTSKQLEEFFQELVNIGRNDINTELVLKIREHQKRGDTVIVLSGALHPFLEAFTKQVDLNVHIISTELSLDKNGVCTGGVGKIINGEAKVEKVQKWIEEHMEVSPFDELEIWAYADSESDIPLLHFVNYPIVVNPNEDMKRIAIKNNWPIFAS